MTKKHLPKHTPKKFLDIIGLILILPPVLYQFGWLNLDIPYLHAVLMLMCIAAILFCVKGFNQPTVSLRILSIVVVIAGTLLAFVNLFKLL